MKQQRTTEEKKQKKFHSQTFNPLELKDTAPSIKKDEIEVLELVGQGQYGNVYKGRCRGLDVAVKILKDKFNENHKWENFIREVEILSRIRFPNVSLLLGACNEPGQLCIVQEYLPNGDLGTLCKQKRLPKSFYARMRYACHVARGLLWIHSTGILHRDLKLENLLLDRHYEVKICDFGLADSTEGRKYIWDPEGKKKGSPLYMAPEVLLGRGITNKVDVYSFGIVLWELLSQQRAFQHHLEHNDMKRFTSAICDENERPPITTAIDEGWKNPYIVDLVNRCWAKQAKDRPEFSAIYEEMNVMVVDGHLNDPWARKWWLVNFPDEEKIKWLDFEKVLISSEMIELEDDDPFCKGLSLDVYDPMIMKDLNALKLLIAQISGLSVQQLQYVTCESFGKLLSWFGPGIDTKTKETFLTRIHNICTKRWFHGLIENGESLVHNNNSYLIRLSTQDGCFTVQTSSVRVRISYDPQQQIYQETNKFYSSLDELIASTNLSTYEECGPSPFSSIYNPPPTECYLPSEDAFSFIRNLNVLQK